MLNADLGAVRLASKWRSHLAKAGFQTTTEVLLALPATLVQRTRLSTADVAQLVRELAQQVQLLPSSATSTVAQLTAASTPDRCTTGDPGLDSLLGGGIHRGSVTEIAGQSASGKSHFCLQLALTVQLAPEFGGLEGGALVISSEGIIASPRLLAMARGLDARLGTVDSAATVDSRDVWDFMDNVLFMKAQDVETLDNLLSYHVPATVTSYASLAASGSSLPPLEPLSSSQSAPYRPADDPSHRERPPRPPLPVRLIIVDSIAAPFRVAHGNDKNGFIQRSKDLGMIADKLKRLACTYNCAVVVVNQVSDVFDDFSSRVPPEDTSTTSTSSSPRGGAGRLAHEQYRLPALLYGRFQIQHFSGQSSRLPMTAALGYSWSNLINTRLMLSRTGRRKRANAVGNEDEQDVLIRRMSLVFSPYAPRGEIDYVLASDGLRSIGELTLREVRPPDVDDEELEEEEDEPDMALLAGLVPEPHDIAIAEQI